MSPRAGRSTAHGIPITCTSRRLGATWGLANWPAGAIALCGGDGLQYDSTATSKFSGTLSMSNTAAALEVDNGTLILSGTST